MKSVAAIFKVENFLSRESLARPRNLSTLPFQRLFRIMQKLSTRNFGLIPKLGKFSHRIKVAHFRSIYFAWANFS
jgi:hypothetical protein